MMTRYSRVLMVMSWADVMRPARKAGRVREVIEAGQEMNHQKPKVGEYPPPPVRLASPKTKWSGERGMRWLIGVHHKKS